MDGPAKHPLVRMAPRPARVYHSGTMLQPILGGCGLGVVLFFLGAGVIGACNAPSLLQCRVDAITALPLDPDTITLGDVKEVARRVKACQARPDGGL